MFLPLYPIVVRAAQGLTGSYLTAGLLVSNLCAILSGYALYELALLDTDRYTARRTVKYLNALRPASGLASDGGVTSMATTPVNTHSIISTQTHSASMQRRFPVSNFHLPSIVMPLYLL